MRISILPWHRWHLKRNAKMGVEWYMPTLLFSALYRTPWPMCALQVPLRGRRVGKRREEGGGSSWAGEGDRIEREDGS